MATLIDKITLLEIKKYIEETEIDNDTRYGSARGLEKLKEYDCLPDVYKVVVELIEKCE